MDIPTQKKRERELTFPSPFSSIWALSGLDDDCPRWWGWVSSLSLLNQMLISSRNTSGTHPEIIFHHPFRDPLVQSTWHIQLNITMYIFYISCWIHFVAFYTYMHIYINIYIFTREVDLSFYFLVLFWFL